MDLKRVAEESLHNIVSGNWKSIPKDLLSYLRREVGVNLADNPVGVAIALIKVGISPEKAAALLNWKKFEDLCLEGFQLSGIDAVKGVRFSVNRRKYEIDLLGASDELVLSVDCKMWSKGSSPKIYKLKEAAIKQLDRTNALASALKIGDLKGIEIEEGESLMIPAIVTWLDFSERILHNIPIIPLYMLPSFLNEIWDFIDDISYLKLNYRVKIKRESH